MTDFTPPPPITVNADPAKDQWEAGVRQVILVVAAVCSALGFAKAAGEVSLLLAAAGPIAGLVVFVWGQVKTRSNAKKLIAMQAHLPDSVATTK